MEITAPADVLQQRIYKRTNEVSDAVLVVVEHQLSNWRPLLKNEIGSAAYIDTSEVLDVDLSIGMIKTR